MKLRHKIEFWIKGICYGLSNIEGLILFHDNPSVFFEILNRQYGLYIFSQEMDELDQVDGHEWIYQCKVTGLYWVMSYACDWIDFRTSLKDAIKLYEGKYD